ncbi:AAA family ATPase [Noviherbaspirillum sp. CPCC 100848]|uniref:AAA family ATPase n=1 Tax=Noviherbaspirillum album TaxID=3080276 RepID=A0ABU6JHJ4_9BURK|nr:AAA family ATPase [Noviherbaspirillum sp. CPCC 100848]MEC4722961.1 AAA family ATPase [Noviherbaspirillum sp. CPCC 100848]
MPSFSKLYDSFKNGYVVAVLSVLLAFIAVAAVVYKPLTTKSNPVVQSQDISEITKLVGNRHKLEYLLLAQPLSDFPRYVFKYKDADEINVVKVPSTSHTNLEREVLLKHAIPYAIAKDEFLNANRAILEDEEAQRSALAEAGAFLARNAIGIALLVFLFIGLRKGMPSLGLGSGASVIKPENLKGSMDDLVGMEDIKREVAHLEEMIINRDLYRSHNIDKPFNVMLTGPAGTGKTKLAGYLAKKLDIPLIQASGSGLESGFVGGGSKALNAIYKKAVAQGRCIIFLDEAQSLFMPRGRGDKKWDDDTANTLLGLLDGVKSEEGSGVIWVVASNFDDANSQMDEAMLRRFAVKINFRLPNKSERRELLNVFLSRKNVECIDWSNLNLDYVAEITANLSPALLETVVDRASMIAIQEKTLIDTDVLFRAFERASIGLTDRATTAEKNKERERVALHELGHFFMQIDPYVRQGLTWDEVKAKSNLLKISTESVSKIGALGYVLSSASDVSLRTLEEMEQDVVQLYGGVAAEELFYGARGISTGSQNDIQKVTSMLDLMVNRLSMYSRSKLDYSQLKSEHSPEDALRQVEAKADELYTRTLDAMKDYKDLISALTGTLLERYVLSKDEVFALLAELTEPPRKAA